VHLNQHRCTQPARQGPSPRACCAATNALRIRCQAAANLNFGRSTTTRGIPFQPLGGMARVLRKAPNGRHLFSSGRVGREGRDFLSSLHARTCALREWQTGGKGEKIIEVGNHDPHDLRVLRSSSSSWRAAMIRPLTGRSALA
jgi:hypothetical protein